MARKSVKGFKKLPGDPEVITRNAVEVIKSLYLKNDPTIVEGILQLAEVAGYKTAPEAVRHLLNVGLSATPMDGEARAAINSVKSQMMQYFGQLFWGMMAELIVKFEKDWNQRVILVKFEEEMARIRAESGQ